MLRLRLTGWRILARRFATPAGEIDIVARRGALIAFVEVKQRTSRAHVLETVTARQRRRIENAASIFLSRHPNWRKLSLRFDVMVVSPLAMAVPLPGRLASRPHRHHPLTMAGLRRIGGCGAGLRRCRRAGPAAALALLLAGSLCLSGCAEFLLGAAATTGLTVAEERSVGTVVDDLTIRTELNHLFFKDNIDLYQDVSFSVIEGRVLLKGSVPTPGDRVRALQLAWQAGGVREVINEIQVTDDSGLLDFARDTWISTQLKAKLLLDSDVLSINYSIETVNGTIYIMGIAQNEAELERVMEYARDIGDVKRIVSHVVMKDDPRRQATP